MPDYKKLTHFLYGRGEGEKEGFWYSHPLDDIDGLTEEQLFWVPSPNSLCILWQVGHIAHRERTHIGKFLQGLQGTIIPSQYEVFGPDWCSTEKVRQSVESVKAALTWVSEVRGESHKYIESLTEDDFQAVPQTSPDGLSVAHWLFITTAHTALHIGRIQLLRSLIEGKHERAC
ncbi:MAG: DinB family protein [Candidatus Cloacimonadota bacterium]|nr:MAG: DinB family protein [Candidatus Cloacimonadota bacterium]